jgi:hypothetical protein
LVQGQVTVWPYAVTGVPDYTNPGLPNSGANVLGGGQSATSRAYQSIDLGPIAAAIDTDRVRYEFSAYLGGYAHEGDTAVAEVGFFAADGTLLGNAPRLDGPTAVERGGVTRLFSYLGTGTSLPVGTRSAVVLLTFVRAANGGSYNNGYADNVSLVLTLPPMLHLPAVRR